MHFQKHILHNFQCSADFSQSRQTKITLMILHAMWQSNYIEKHDHTCGLTYKHECT